MAASLAIALRNLFAVLGCLITAIIIYTVATDGLPFRIEILTTWLAATLIDFYIHVFIIGSWVVYKESNWITAILWVVLLICLGSITTCGYIVLQFCKLSTQESLQDPIYFVLLQRQKKSRQWWKHSLYWVWHIVVHCSLFIVLLFIDHITVVVKSKKEKLPVEYFKYVPLWLIEPWTETERQRKCSLLTARILSPSLSCLMLGTLIYSIVTDGSPFRRDVFTPWMTTTVIDFYVNAVALSVWIAYKESSWLSAAFWIILMICLGSISTCAYIALQLFSLSSQDPVYLVLFSSRNRAENGYEGTSQRESIGEGQLRKKLCG